MDLISIAIFGADFTTIMFLITSILGFRAFPFYNKRLRFFFFYVVFTLVTSVILYITRRMGSNIYISYLITPVYLILFTLFLLPEKGGKNERSIIFTFLSIGILLNIYEAFMMTGGVHQYNSIANTFISLFLGTLALKNLISLRYNDSIINLASEPLFWLFIAIAIKSFGNLITTAFYRIVQDIDNEQLLNMVLTSMVVNYVGIFLYWIAFTKARRKIPKQFS